MSATVCRVPGCEGMFHPDGVCSAELISVPLGTGSLCIEMVSDPDEPDYLDVSAYCSFLDTEDMRVKLSDIDAAIAFAKRMRQFATVVELAAVRLASRTASEVTA